jgi:hypothetical protein
MGFQVLSRRWVIERFLAWINAVGSPKGFEGTIALKYSGIDLHQCPREDDVVNPTHTEYADLFMA